MQISLRFQVFAISCFLLASFSMVYLSNTMTIWNGAESSFLSGLSDGSKPSFLPYLFNQIFSTENNFFATIPRLMGVSLLTIALGFFFFTSTLLIGKKTAIMTVLICISSFLFPVLAKIATSDIWLFSLQLMAYISMIRYLKTPELLYRILFYLFIAGSLLIQPLSSLIIFLAAPTFIMALGKEKKRLLLLNPWIAVLLLFAVFHFTGYLYWENDTFLFNNLHFGYGKFALVLLIGMLPFFGYMLGGFRDTFYKLKNREEFTVFFLPLFLFGLIAQSPLAAFGLAILIAKQMILFLQKNYPFGNWIKVGGVLNLTFSFFIAMFLMLKGLGEFGGLGFRVGLGFSIAYWSLGVAGLIGLFSKDKRLLWGGVILNGLMTFLILVSAVYPLLETKRDTANRLFNEIGKNAYIEQVVLLEQTPLHQKRMPLLSKLNFSNLTIDSTSSFSEAINSVPPKTMLIFKQLQFDSTLLTTYPNMKTVSGWDDSFNMEYWSAIVK